MSEAAEKKPAPATPPADTDPSRADPKQTRVLSEHKFPSPLIACRYDPKSRWVFAAGEDRDVQRVPLEDGTTAVFTGGHDSWVRSLGFDLTGETLITGGYDGRLVWWPAAADKPEPQRKVNAHQGWIRALAVSPDGALIATCGNDQLVKLWELATGRLVRELAGHNSHVYQVAFDPTGQALVSTDLKANFKQWNVADGKLAREFSAPALTKYDKAFYAQSGGARTLTFGDEGKLLAAGGQTNITNAFAGVHEVAMVTFDWQHEKLPQRQSGKQSAGSGVIWSLCWHADGYWVAASGGAGGGYLIFFRPGEESDFHALKLRETARDMDLRDGGFEVAVAHSDKTLRRYTLAPAPPTAEKPKVDKTT